MTATQPHQLNGAINGIAKSEKNSSVTTVEYFPASPTGNDGPDQVLASDIDTTTSPDGRVRIKKDNDGINHVTPMSIPGLLKRTAQNFPNRIAMVAAPDAQGNRQQFTYREYEDSVRTVAKAFLKLGLERHHSVCILGFNSPHWFISDIAAIYAGGFAAGIYTTNSAEACQYCLENSRANIVVLEDEKQLEKILKVKDQLPKLKAIIQYEGVPKTNGVLSWNELLEIGRSESEDKLEAVLKKIGANECSTLVYTSGTVGNPKAVMLSHDNILHDARAIITTLNFPAPKPGDDSIQEVVVSYLPLSHVAAQIVDIFAIMILKGTIYFADKNALKGSLLDTLLVARPTVFLGVPRVWEKFHEKMKLVARNNGKVKTWIATWAKSQGLTYNTNKMNGVDYKGWGYLIAKWLVFSKVKAALGLDRAKIFVSAAAPLGDDFKQYFMSLDIPVMEAYGMSECSGAHTLATNSNFRHGSVGPVMAGFCTKLDNIDSTGEGEICMGGRHVFMGYLNQPTKTTDAKDHNGWLHSGDLGRLDDSGYLYITGRIKELIITAGGENIPPVTIEQLVLSELPALSYAMLIGDRRKYLTMLVTIKTEMDPDTGEPLDNLAADSKDWIRSIGSNAKTLSEILSTKDPLVYQGIEEAIKRANAKSTSNAQKVQKFRILPHDFSVPTGELGPTLKVKRNVVAKKYTDLIDSMYNE